MWTPAELAAFETVTIASSGYLNSVAHKAALACCPDIHFVPEEVVGPTGARPRALIHYFTRGHRGSTRFWKTPEGRRCLGRVRRYLEGVSHPAFFWSGNDDVCHYLTGVMPGLEVSPKQEGTNQLCDLTSCALIYSAKKTPSDAPTIEQFGITSEDIETSREMEDIAQFTMRGGLRKPNFDGDFIAYLYDLHQAKWLAAYLEENGIATVELVPVVEVGIMDVTRPKRDRGQKEELDERSKTEKKEQRRANDRERKAREREAKAEQKKQNGTYRSQGRPKKAKPQTSEHPSNGSGEEAR